MPSSTAQANTIIELRTLGSLDLRTSNGDELRSVLAQPKRIALLSYLAIATPRGFQRRDSLVGLFWPEIDQAHARAALRQALHFLRRALGTEVVLSRGAEDVGLDFRRLRCDVVSFEECIQRGDVKQAVEIYGGPLLRGFSVTDASEFERWLDSERERLARLYVGALESLAAAATAAGDAEEAVARWRHLARHDPYNSQVTLKLMVALDKAGHRAGAIAHAYAHAQVLRDELGVEPAVEVFELADRLRDESLRRSSVEREETPSIPRDTTPDVEPAAVMALDQETNAGRTSQRLARRAAAVALALLAGYWLYGDRPVLSANAEAARPTVAVLPFESSGSTGDGYFARGMAEGVVDRLGGVRALSVFGPTYGGLGTGSRWVQVTGAELGGEYALRATVARVQQDGALRIRVTPALTRVASGNQLWTAIFEEDASRLFEVQARIAEGVAQFLGVHLLRTEREWLRAAPTHNLTAYDLYLQGNELLTRDVHQSENVRTAVELYARAAELDTTFAQAHAKHAIAHTSMFWWNHDRTPRRLAKAKAAADAAVRLRPDLPLSHLALGWYYYWGMLDYDLALRHFELARASWPGITDVLVLIGGIRRRQGDFDQALATYEEAAAINPACGVCAAELAYTHLTLRDYAAAERAVERALALAPNFQYPRFVGALVSLSFNGDLNAGRRFLPPPDDREALFHMATGRWSTIIRILGGEYDRALGALTLDGAIEDTAGYYLAKAELLKRTDGRAVAHYDSARAILEAERDRRPDDPLVRSALGLAYAGLGRGDDAVREGLAATHLRPLSLDAVDGPLALETLARIYTAVGDLDAAIDQVQTLLSIPSALSVGLLRLDPTWTRLHSEPRFQRLLR